MDGSAVIGLFLMFGATIVMGLIGFALAGIVLWFGVPWWCAFVVGILPIPTFFWWQFRK